MANPARCKGQRICIGIGCRSNTVRPAPPVAATNSRRPPMPCPRPGIPRRTRSPRRPPCGEWHCRAASPERSPAAPLLPAIPPTGWRGGEQARRALGTGRAGMDAVDRDPVTAQLHRQRLGHVHQAGIACAAAEIAGVAGVGTADVDDAAPARRLHERDDSAGTAQRADILHVEIFQQILVDDRFDWAGRGGRTPGADPLLTRMWGGPVAVPPWRPWGPPAPCW